MPDQYIASLYTLELTNDQKIAILEKTKELLGPNGENWTKSCWFGTKKTDEEMNQWLLEWGFEPLAELDQDELLDIAQHNDWRLFREELPVHRADQANVWCLMGAIEEAAYRLKITPERDTSERLAGPISLERLVNSKSEWRTWSVIDVNDNPDTTFETVRDLLDERLTELVAEGAHS